MHPITLFNLDLWFISFVSATRLKFLPNYVIVSAWLFSSQHYTQIIGWEVFMARNEIQFQKGVSLFRFNNLYGTEAQCYDRLFSLRWSNGFVCPTCGGKEYCQLKRHSLYQCNTCHQQTSLTAGTILDNTKLPLTKWFLAIFLLTQVKNGISALELSRLIEVSYIQHSMAHEA